MRAPDRAGTQAVRMLLVLGLTAAALLGPAVSALAVGSGTATVKPAAEGWYRLSPTCALPTGCADLSAAPSTYAPDTLHVGVNTGTEEARTYLQLDLARLPAGTKPSGGTLLLPVASGSNEGTRAPETAKLRACAVEPEAEVEDVDGSFATPPAADCETAEVEATFVAATGAAPAAFTVDLGALASAWDGSARPGAVALVPAAETAAPQSWHVAFSDRTRTGVAVVPISAALAFVSASFDTAGAEPPFVAAPPFEPASAPSFDSASSFGATDLSSGTSFAAPSISAVAPLLPVPVAQAVPVPQAAAPVQQVVPVAQQALVSSGFRYPAVFLLPLLIAIGVGYLGRALTRDLVAVRR